MKNVIKVEHSLRDQLLQVMIDNKGSDMYITVGTHPAIKVAGEIMSIDNEDVHSLTWKDTLEFTQSLINEEQHDRLLADKNLDFSFSYANARFRGNISFQTEKYMVVIRLLNAEIPDIETL